MVEPDFNTHCKHLFHFCPHNLLRESEFRDTVHQDTPCFMQGLKQRDLMPEPG